MSVDICPKCGILRDMIESTCEREETNNNGDVVKIITKSFHCSFCNCFVNSEDIIVPKKKITEK